MQEVMNAKIQSASIKMGVHGCLTYDIYLKLADGSSCAFGGYCIGHGFNDSDHFDGYGKGLVAMMHIMDVVGVDKWEDLEGKYVRVKSEGWGSSIHEIGNIMSDKWFNQKNFFSSNEENEECKNYKE